MLTPLKRALVAIAELQARLDAAESAKNGPIAIIGLGCRFPGGADTPADFWKLLADGRNAVGEVPETRWPNAAFYDPDPAAIGKISTRHGGFLGDIEGFDPAFFGVSPREAASMDPQHRLLLEVSWEALAAAGQLNDRMEGSSTGVFVGITTVEFGQLQLAAQGLGSLDAYHITGNALNAAAGRIAYVFGLQGPCIAVDTACSSSLVALHLACASLRAGECATALVAGVNLILSPHGSIALSRGRVLSPTGQTRAFDAGADGMVRGEGCGVLVLKRLDEALRAGDHVLAVVRGSGVNQDGASSGLTVPNGPAQEALLRRILKETKTDPHAVAYIEAHGTGTALGDPIEAGAIGAAYCSDRPMGDPLWLGSVKTNIGHLESAAGVASIIKVVLALQHGQLPAHLHFRTPSPHIPWDRWPLRVPTSPVPWPRGDRPRIAGVSSFGFSGTNAHVLLEEAPSESSVPDDMRGLAAPPSPFRRGRYPVPQGWNRTLPVATAPGHPLLGSALAVAGSDELRFDGVFGPKEAAFLADHRVFGMVVLPAAAWLELALVAARRFAGDGSHIRNLAIRQPLVFLDGASRQVQTVVAPTDSGGAVKIYSRPTDASSPNGASGWVLHLEADVAPGPHVPAPIEELSEAESRCLSNVVVSDSYTGFRSQGLDYGPAFRALVEIRSGIGDLVAEVRLPEGLSKDRWTLHPVLLDACFQAAGAVFGNELVLLPVGVGLWRVWAPAPISAVRVHARVRRGVGAMTADFDLFDEAGGLVAQLVGLVLQQASPESLRRTLQRPAGDCLYEVAWSPAPLDDTRQSVGKGSWLVVGNGVELVADFAERLRSHGNSVVLASPGEVGAALAEGSNWLGCVFLATYGEREASTAYSHALEVMHALIDQIPPTQLWIVTHGATAADGGAVAPAAAAIWGLGRVLANEHPELACRLIDLDPNADPAGSLAVECLRPDSEDQIAWRAGNRFAARLTRLNVADRAGIAIHANGVYMITGGLGALGLLAADWLVRRGGRRLVLVARNPPSSAAREKIAAWRREGVVVTVFSADMGDRAAVGTVVREGTRGMPLRGIVHAAGAIDDGVLRQQTPERFERVLAAKALGAAYLDELTQGQPLDFFVIFSSAAAVLGTPGQANYAAANAYVDALAHVRRAAGRPALSVNWGPWDMGMAAEKSGRYSARGIGTISPELGFGELERLLGAGVSQAIVMPIAWPQFVRSFGDHLPRLLAGLGAKGQEALRTDRGLRERLAAASSAERLRLLEEYVRGEVAKVLHVEAAKLAMAQPLNTLGLDSLMAIELRNQIRIATDLDVPVVRFLDGATVAALVQELAAGLGESSTGQRSVEPQASAPHAVWPLSSGQEALWFLYRTSPASAAYHTAFALRLRGPLNSAALARAFQILANRHPLLRASFPSEQGAPSLVVAGQIRLEPSVVDASLWDSATLDEHVAGDYSRPFELEGGPLVRVTLYRKDASDHVLLCTIHHIIGDAWTNWVLLDELRRLYAAACAGRAIELPSLPATHADFAGWQRERMTGTAGDELWQYWHGQLSGELPVLNLPVDMPRPVVLSPSGAAVHLDLPAPLLDRVRQLARAQGATPFAVLLAAWLAFLHRHTGQDDIIVGSPTAGRSRQEFAGLAGYFVNPVPLRANLAEGLRFTELLAQARQTILGALGHADMPLPALVERLRLPRDPGRTPLFQTLFVYQKPPESAAGAREVAGWGGLGVEEYPLVQMAGQFELMLEIFEGAGASLKYHSELFTPETARRFARRFRVLLEGIVADPDCRVSDLPLLDDAERLQVVRAWNETPADYPQQFCLHQLIAQQVARTPSAIAVEYEGTALTFAELDVRADRLAHWLRRAGVGPDVLVGVSAERSIELVVALLAILKAGGAYVPLDPAYPAERLKFMLEDSAVSLVLTQARLAGAWSNVGVRVLQIDGEWPVFAGEPTEAHRDAVVPDSLAYMIYTSGSTGRPKGVPNTHRAIVNRLLWMQDTYKLTASDSVMQKTPFSFDVSVWEFFWPLLAGARLVMARPGGHQDAAYLTALVAHSGVTTMHFVPSMLQVFVEDPGLARCKALRQVFCSGEALSADLRTRFFDRHPAELHNLYGPTEAAVDVTSWHCARNDLRPVVPIGRPIARTQMHVLDRRMQPAPPGSPGELHIGGIGLARGYHRRPDLTAEKFVPDPYGPPGARLYRTGDLARWLADGTLEYLGRLDHQVKLRGFRIELGEIEAALTRQRGVHEAVVIVREDHLGDRQLVAYITLGMPEGPGEAALRSALRASLPEYMVPGDFVVLKELPLSSNGKVDRRRLPAPSRSPAAPNKALGMLETRTEKVLAALWCEVLGREHVGAEDNFFDIGGHSLRLGLVHARLQRLYPQAPELVELFQYPTIRALAARIDGAVGAPPTTQGERGAVRSAHRGGLRDQRALRRGTRDGGNA